MTKPIGGYFELELNQGEHYHKEALRLNSARNCLEYILRVRKYQKVYIPYYTCEAIIAPFHRLNIQYQFYHINENLEPIETPTLHNNEAFLYTNYFGLKQKCVELLSQYYGTRLIIDNAQAFFAPHVNNIDTFYSPRKFLGVPDGGYLYINDTTLYTYLTTDTSWHKMTHLLKRIDLNPQDGYQDFLQNENAFNRQPLQKMSKLTSALLKNTNYKFIQEQRLKNFYNMHKLLNDTNSLSIVDDLEGMAIPMIYPYYNKNINSKTKLLQNNIFVATYWPNIQLWCKTDDLEYKLMQHLIPLPIDQRYNSSQLIRKIKQNI